MIILLIIAFLGLVIGSVTDIKIREVPDWVSYGLIFFGLGIRLIYSVITFNWIVLLSGIAGFALFLALAFAMFYTAQWGGGDSKILMGLGALIGLDFNFTKLPMLISFLINALLIGAVYGLIFSFVLGIKHRRKLSLQMKRLFLKKHVRAIKFAILALLALALIFSFWLSYPVKAFVLLIGVIPAVTFYVFTFVKAVELSCMFKEVEPEKLTEGDWIVKDIVVAGKRICGPKDLGISRKQIAELVKLKKQKKLKKILIKEGLPFVPSFLIAFILTLILEFYSLNFFSLII